MIDLTKPIRQKCGDAAKYCGALPDGKVVIAYSAWSNGKGEKWNAIACALDHADLHFENIPPEPATARLYVWWGEDGVKIVSRDPEDAQRWRDNGWKVSEHMVTEPCS